MKKIIDIEKDPERRRHRIIGLIRQNDIIAMLLEGRDPVKEIRPYLTMKYGIPPQSAANHITEARNVVKERKIYEVNNLISMHINRYETIYAALYEIGAHSYAMQALKQKEKLLGFHKEGFHMKVTQGEIQAISLQTVMSEYDVMKLGREKNDRMSVLLNKMKRDPALIRQKIIEYKKKYNKRKREENGSH